MRRFNVKRFVIFGVAGLFVFSLLSSMSHHFSANGPWGEHYGRGQDREWGSRFDFSPPYIDSSASAENNFNTCQTNPCWMPSNGDSNIGGMVQPGQVIILPPMIGQQSYGQSYSEGDTDNPLGSPFMRLFGMLGLALATAALSGLGAAVFPRQLRRARDAAISNPATVAIVGFVALMVALGVTIVYGLSLILVITAVLLPVVSLAWVAIGLVGFAGWVVVAEPFGRIVLARLGIHTVPMVAATVGAFVLTFGLELASTLPCVGWLSIIAALIVGSAGLGALMLTRIGTRSYPRRVSHIEMI